MTMFIGEPAESLALREAGLDVVPTTAGEVAGATAATAWDDSVSSRLLRVSRKNALYGTASQPSGDMADLLRQQEYPTEGPFADIGQAMRKSQNILLTPEEANDRFKAPGMTPFKTAVPDMVAQSIYDEHQKNLARQNIRDRAEGGLLTSAAAQFGLSALVGLADPINVASAFVPVVGPARIAAALERASGPFGRAGVRAGVGVVEGAAGAALLEPLIYATDQQLHNDWTMGNAAMNIGLGALMGGALHTGVGAVADWRAGVADRAMSADAARLSSESRDLALRESIAAHVEGKDTYAAQIAVASELKRAADGVSERAVAVEAMAADVARVAEVRSLGNEVRGSAGRMGRPERAPVSLLEFIGLRGGVQEQGGDLRAIGADVFFVPGQGRIVRKNGMALDYAREAAEEEGYLPPNSTIADFLNAVAEEVAGRRVYLPHEAAIAAERRMARMSDREQEKVAEYRSAILQLSDDYGIRISDGELEHAMILSMDGVHPDEAIRLATIGEDFRATGFLDESDAEAASIARMKESDAAELTARVARVAREVEALRKAYEPGEDSAVGQLSRLESLQTELDNIVKTERDAARWTPAQEAWLREADAGAKDAEGTARAFEAAGFCAAVRG